MWISKLVKFYIGISVSGVLLALGLLLYVLVQDDVVVFVLAFIDLGISAFFAFLDIQAVRLAQQGKTGLAKAGAVFWASTIIATLMSSDHQWQSRLLYYIFDAVTIVKIVILMILINNKAKFENRV